MTSRRGNSLCQISADPSKVGLAVVTGLTFIAVHTFSTVFRTSSGPGSSKPSKLPAPKMGKKLLEPIVPAIRSSKQHLTVGKNAECCADLTVALSIAFLCERGA